jgi:chromosome segregation ATPase
LLSGCARERQLERTLAVLETQLARKQEVAQNLDEYRRELASLEARHTEGLAALSDAGVLLRPELESLRPPAPLPTAPPKGVLETPRSAKLRVMISDTERRLAELDSALGELDRAWERRRELEGRLESLHRMLPNSQ